MAAGGISRNEAQSGHRAWAAASPFSFAGAAICYHRAMPSPRRFPPPWSIEERMLGVTMRRRMGDYNDRSASQYLLATIRWSFWQCRMVTAET